MENDPALEDLLQYPQRFEFTQAMRLLLRENRSVPPDETRSGRFDWAREPVRVAAHQSLAFPTADIQSLGDKDESGKRPMRINFLGLTGPSGVLPHVYTELLSERSSETAAARDFFDLFNHRMAMLFYYAWEKYRFAVLYEDRTEQDVFRWIVLSLVGLASENLPKIQNVPDDFFIKYAALLALQPRSACALRTILADHFRVPVEVEQFAGGWFHLDQHTASGFRDEVTGAEKLGFGVVVGREYWSQESAVRLRIGPMGLKTFRDFLPDGPWCRQLAGICRFFSREEIVFDVQLILDKQEVPATLLRNRPREEEQDDRPRLGWTTWARGAGPASRDADDVTFRLFLSPGEREA